MSKSGWYRRGWGLLGAGLPSSVHESGIPRPDDLGEGLRHACLACDRCRDGGAGCYLLDVLLEDTEQGQLLGEGGGDSRREGVFSEKSKSENR